jgi:5'-3' exonuclease
MIERTVEKQCSGTGPMVTKMTKELIDRIFKEPGIKYELTEFETLGKPIDGIEQLKSYMNAKGAPVAVWSNGSDSIILYRPYPKEFDNAARYSFLISGLLVFSAWLFQ